MKTRMGFVSNSSSSSFVVAVDNTPEAIGKLLSELVRFRLFTDEEQLKDFFMDDRGWYEEDLEEDYFYQEMLKRIREGKAVMNHVVDWGDDHAYYILSNPSTMEKLNAEYLGDMHG